MTGRIVLGLGGTVDYELEWDAAAFQRLVDGYGIRLAEVEDDPPSAVPGGRGIVLAVLRSMRRGRGCECYVEDKSHLLAFDARFHHRVTLGGTGVRAALAMSRLGVASTVHLVSISDEVRRGLPQGVAHLCSAEEDSLDPHVIVQYPHGAAVRLVDGTVVAGRPNRVILVNDEPNEHMVLSRGLPAALRQASAVLISGLNTMKRADDLRARLAELAGMLRGVPQGAPVVYEDAGFHDEAMRAVVLEVMPSLASVHSLNEDEARHYLGRQVDLTDPQEVAAMMEGLQEILGAPTVMNTMKRADDLRARLAELAGMLRGVPQGAPVVYEDAGFHDEAMRAVVLEVMPSLASVHSLNEDEARHYLGRQVDLTDPQEVAAMMEGLQEILGAPTVMVHTSRYAACVGAQAGLYRDAARAGCLLASTRFAHGDRYGRAEYDAVAASPREPVGVALAGAVETRRAGVLIAPGYDVRTAAPTTIGLGDAFIGGVMAHLAASGGGAREAAQEAGPRPAA